MAENDYNHFVCIVAGDNPDELINKYNNKNKIGKHVIYSFKDAHKLKEAYMKMYEKLLEKDDLHEFERLTIESELEGIKEDNDVEFFSIITNGYEHDPDTGDAISYENTNGKYSLCNIGHNFSTPFILLDGSESFQARKKDINWERLHMNKEQTHIYGTVWDLVLNKKKPENDTEKLYYENMKDNGNYLKKFTTRENYIANMCSFWGYAFLSEETGWVELEPDVSQFLWVSCFFERFIVSLPQNTLLTIYECRK